MSFYHQTGMRDASGYLAMPAQFAPHVGANTPFAVHLGRGALPSHESGLDCRIRVFSEGPLVCGVCRCDTSYGPVVLTAKADARLIGSVLVAARGVRQHLLKQAVELPTESGSAYVAKAARLRDLLGQKNPQAAVILEQVKALAASGDKKASAFLALVLSQDPKTGAPIFGAARLPRYHRAGVAIPGSAVKWTAANHDRIARALKQATAHIHPAARTSRKR